MRMRAKFKVEWQVCARCGAHLYPPIEVSDVGIKDYEEVFEAPPVEPEKVPTDEELAEINKRREELGLPSFASVGEWVADYRSWAEGFRARVRGEGQDRYVELSEGVPPRVKALQMVEEAKAFRIVGKRRKALYEPTEAGWRLKCPSCGFITLEWKK